MPNRREPPRYGLQMFVAGFNFLSNERVGILHSHPSVLLCAWESACLQPLVPQCTSRASLFEAGCIFLPNERVGDTRIWAGGRTGPLPCSPMVCDRAHLHECTHSRARLHAYTHGTHNPHTHTHTHQDVYHRFSKYGKVTEVRIVRDAGGKSRGFGFVAMDNEEDVQRVGGHTHTHTHVHTHTTLLPGVCVLSANMSNVSVSMCTWFLYKTLSRLWLRGYGQPGRRAAGGRLRCLRCCVASGVLWGARMCVCVRGRGGPG